MFKDRENPFFSQIMKELEPYGSAGRIAKTEGKGCIIILSPKKK